MRKLFAIIMLIGVVFAQDMVAFEKIFDKAASAKNAMRTAENGNVNGVTLTDEQMDELVRSAAADLQSIKNLIDGVGVVDPTTAIIGELVDNSATYFWKTPRADSVAKLQAALAGDMDGVQYLIDNYRTRIYSAYHDYVLGQLTIIMGG